jgi:hypothetical protein
MTTAAPSSSPRLSEDWLATIIGLAIVLIIGAGLLGPGPQNVTITAPPGETAELEVLPLSNWQVTATLGGESTSIENAWTSLGNGQVYAYSCHDSVITGESPVGDDTGTLSSRALVVIINECDAEIRLTQRTNAAIPWPVFGLFGR